MGGGEDSVLLDYYITLVVILLSSPQALWQGEVRFRQLKSVFSYSGLIQHWQYPQCYLQVLSAVAYFEQGARVPALLKGAQPFLRVSAEQEENNADWKG